jgi:hypothetical protein
VKRAALVIVLLVFSVAIISQLSFNTQTVLAQDANYSIQSVDHEIEVLYSGHVVIRDTIHISGQLTGDFLIGFPYKYGSSILKSLAYDADNTFQVSLGVQLADRSGFYGAKISFPEGAPQVFTVVFILSNSLVSQGSATGVFTLDFPAYPSFVKDVSQCSVTITLPEIYLSMTITKDDGIVSTNSFIKMNLPAFSYFPAQASFTLSSNSLQIINIKELNRQITINPIGDVAASDSYRITNNAPSSIASLKITLPLEASKIVTRDEFGRILTTDIQSGNGDTRLVNVTFTSPLASGQSFLLTVEYTLPSISSEQAPQYTLNFDLFPDFEYYVDTATVTFVLPEGARLLAPQLSAIDSSLSLSREVFQESLTITRDGVSNVDSAVLSNDALQVTYNYNPLWLSFRPTVWVWALAVIGTIVLIVRRRPKTAAPRRVAATKASVGLSPDHVRSFTDGYSEKTRLTSELKTIEERAQKGKIPRRRYKVQRRNLEVRLDNISKTLSELKRTFRSAGGVYADLVRQLDAAEVELVEVETNIRTSEVRHRRGELPLEAYKKALADSQRRKEKAEATINGILLRLREEIR